MWVSAFGPRCQHGLMSTCSAGPTRQTWIDICQKAAINPKELIEKHIDKLLQLVLHSTTMDAKVSIPLLTSDP